MAWHGIGITRYPEKHGPLLGKPFRQEERGKIDSPPLMPHHTIHLCVSIHFYLYIHLHTLSSPLSISIYHLNCNLKLDPTQINCSWPCPGARPGACSGPCSWSCSWSYSPPFLQRSPPIRYAASTPRSLFVAKMRWAVSWTLSWPTYFSFSSFSSVFPSWGNRGKPRQPEATAELSAQGTVARFGAVASYLARTVPLGTLWAHSGQTLGTHLCFNTSCAESQVTSSPQNYQLPNPIQLPQYGVEPLHWITALAHCAGSLAHPLLFRSDPLFSWGTGSISRQHHTAIIPAAWLLPLGLLAPLGPCAAV